MPEAFTVEPLNKLRLPQSLTKLQLIAIALGVLILGGLGIWFFGRAQFSESKIEFVLSGPSDVAAGDIVQYSVKYKNPNKVGLKNARLVFHYPPEAIALHDGARAEVSQESMDLKTIGAHSEGEQHFEALIVGHQGNVKLARAVLDFMPENLTTQLQKSTELGTTITSMPVALNVVVPPTLIAGQTVSYIIDYRNQTPDQLRNLTLRAQFPEGFKPTQAKTNWQLPVLSAGDGGRITITGTIQGREKETKTLSVSLQKEIVTSTGRFVADFEKAEGSSVIATPLLSLALSLNSTTDYTAHIGDSLTYRLVVTNNTDVDLSSFALTAQLDGTMFDLTTVQSAGSFDGRTRTLLWNSAVVSELGFLRAHQSATIPFQVALKESFAGGALGTQNSFIKVSGNVETFNVPEAFPVESLSASDELVTKISTAPAFVQKLVDGGPPKVDQTSTYTVRWMISNPANAMAPAKVTGVLLPGVSWGGLLRTAGTQIQPSYNPSTSTITWDLGSVPAGVGVTTPAYELFFHIAITPSVNQVGQSPELLTGAKFEGTDVLTKEKIILNVPVLTTGAAVKP